ncbi:MAG: type III glutamate--ammonia ligase [Verrucomicrobiales bacterium]|nr:type III glutamate--ammonia ligase [Verrucomicrobiales bacterium]
MDLEDYGKKNGVRFFLISYSDLNGVNRSKLVPHSAIAGMQENGAGFAGFASYLDLTPADPDLFAIPDSSSVIQLPWNKEVAWVAADLHMNGKPLAQAPRNVLKRVRERSDQKGVACKTGVECEFMLLDPETLEVADHSDTLGKPCYDQEALMRRYDLISRICTYMEELGWGPYQNDHEDGNGQFEMNWEFTECLQTADRHAFFKFMVRSLTEEAGLKATFMPKPKSTLTGNGSHVHVSLWNDKGANLFEDPAGELGLSETAYHFLGGILNHASALSAITNPTVNSYRRLHGATTRSGATWAPNTISYSGNNRTHMIRIPDTDRIELRSPDGSVNPYLLPAAIMAVGLDGIESNLDAGERKETNSYTEKDQSLQKLPATLHESLMNLRDSAVLRDYLGDSLVDSFCSIKMLEWDEYVASVSPWETERYFGI